MKAFLLSLLCLILCLACGNKYDSGYSHEVAYDAIDVPVTTFDRKAKNLPHQPMMEESSARISLRTGEKIIRDAYVHYEVKDIQEANSKIRDLVKKHEGFVVSENQFNDNYRNNYAYVIRVNNARFDDLINELVGIAHRLEQKRVNAQDVTEEFIDIESRLKTKKTVEKRYIELLQKAKTVEEIINVEEKLRVLREEIESVEGRLKYLNDRVNYSTINLNAYEQLDYRYVPEPMPDFFERLLQSLDHGWKNIVSFVLFLVQLWPFWILGTALVLWVRKIRRSKNRK
jgi:DNA repair exonuclease SbcCD ATPase subunit